jgi:hypothetical protein
MMVFQGPVGASKNCTRTLQGASSVPRHDDRNDPACTPNYVKYESMRVLRCGRHDHPANQIVARQLLQLSPAPILPVQMMACKLCYITRTIGCVRISAQLAARREAGETRLHSTTKAAKELSQDSKGSGTVVNKQPVAAAMDERLYSYLLDHTREPEVWTALLCSNWSLAWVPQTSPKSPSTRSEQHSED